MVTEAGIIGKIGLNSMGVGVCLNAIKARGLDFEKLPCHLALRAVLDSKSRCDAVKVVKSTGIASSCHLLIADETGGTGLECSHADIIEIPMSNEGIVTHKNHFIKEHGGSEDKMALKDSPARLKRINELVEANRDSGPGFELFRTLLADEANFPTSICREQTDESSVATLFSIVMDLKERCAEVTEGRPSNSKDISYYLRPLDK